MSVGVAIALSLQVAVPHTKPFVPKTLDCLCSVPGFLLQAKAAAINRCHSLYMRSAPRLDRHHFHHRACCKDTRTVVHHMTSSHLEQQALSSLYILSTAYVPTPCSPLARPHGLWRLPTCAGHACVPCCSSWGLRCLQVVCPKLSLALRQEESEQ